MANTLKKTDTPADGDAAQEYSRAELERMDAAFCRAMRKHHGDRETGLITTPGTRFPRPLMPAATVLPRSTNIGDLAGDEYEDSRLVVSRKRRAAA
jgi:hypothetical protein